MTHAAREATVPANRSRTENWRQSLQDLYQKGGAIEITLPHHAEEIAQGDEPAAPGANLIWRVRLLGLTANELIIEQPAALGHPIHFENNIELVGLIAIGQNRWMFRTTNLGITEAPGVGGRFIKCYRLQMPDNVERCQRRNFYRISTVGLVLPKVDVYPLLNPVSAAVAEAASRCRILDMQDHHIAACPASTPEPVMPEVGPGASAVLVNIGGGGVGLLFDHDSPIRLDMQQLYWMCIDLQPQLPAPLAVSARLRHTHIDSTMRSYAGMSFDFGHSPGHEKFVVDQLLHYVAELQRSQANQNRAA